MKYALVLACLGLAVGCDPVAPRGDVPQGTADPVAYSTYALPQVETGTDTGGTDTGGTDTGGTGCDDPCTTAASCSGYSDACYSAVCSSGCCGSKPRAGANPCTNGCCIATNGACSCDASGNPVITCNSGYSNCDGDASNGCETQLTAILTCGPSCTNCVNSVQHVTTDEINCSNATSCDYTSCDPGWADCDGNRANGCERSTLTSIAHCGGCNKPCTAPANASPVCNAGQCDFVCNSTFMRCGSECKLCCGDGDCTAPPTKCDAGKCIDGTCAYSAKVCFARDCYTTPTCDLATGECKSNPVTGGSCGNNLCVTGSGSCDTGVCTGATAKDCSSGVPLCKVGVCDPATGNCAYEDQGDGTACTPTDKCYEPGVCIAGACNGAKKTCADPGVCKSSICNSSTGVCDVLPLVKGSPCTLNNPCRQNEVCDGDGVCMGTQLSDGSPCPASCASDENAQCTSGVCGCVKLPDLAAPIDPDPGFDLGAADLSKAGGHDKSGCSLADSASPSIGSVVSLFLFGLLLYALGRPHTRLMQRTRHRRR